MLPKLVLNLIGYPQQYTAHYTENAIQEIWNYLLFCSDLPVLKKTWDGKDIPEELFLFVSTSVKQGYEYFKASQGVSLNTRPLLLYYSMLNLAKGAISIRLDSKAEKHHGLTAFSEADDLFQISATMTNGAFNQLAELLEAGWIKQKNLKFTFEDFSTSTIDIGSDLLGFNERIQRYIIVKIEAKTDGSVFITAYKDARNDISSLKEIFQKREGFLNYFQIESETDSTLTYKNSFEIPDGANGYLEHGAPIVEKFFNFILRPGNPKTGFFDCKNKNEIIPQPCAYLGMLFLLGSAVRYSPDKLTRWLSDTEHNKRLLIETVCQLASRVFPNHILNLLTASTHRFAPSF